ncbi:hypothetical protein NST69_17880 [Paenibacillus sp. FSL P2-0089]|uniref:hypothetical protein n=1 Tax=Paenibacillus sp. FSL P2-0089 TaxID=2954526 RepID=UPI00315A16BF
MANFNLGMKYDGSFKLSITELCNEIALENQEMDNNSTDTLRNKFKNSDKSGLIDKLNEKINFRIEEFNEAYEKLKLLKYLYNIEKKGLNRGRKLKRIRIIDILNKPSMDNIVIENQSNSEYGDVLTKIQEDIGVEIKDEVRLDKLGKIKEMNDRWNSLQNLCFKFIMSDEALANPGQSLFELNRIEKFLELKILNKIPDIRMLKLPYRESLFNVFYNLLICHHHLCTRSDLININKQISIDNVPSEENIQTFIKYENYLFKDINLIYRIINDNTNDLGKLFIFMIFDKNEIDPKDKKDLKSALNYIETLMEWIKDFKPYDFTNGYPLSVLITSIQEIIFLKRNKDNIKNEYYGNKYQNPSLISALKNPDRLRSIEKFAWISRIENRYAVNIGAIEMLKVKRRIDTNLYKITSRILEYQNLEDIQLAYNFITGFISRCLISRSLAEELCENFSELLFSYCGYKTEIEDINIFDMFREFLISEVLIEDLTKYIAEEVMKFCQGYRNLPNVNFIIKEVIHNFSLNYNNTFEKRFVLKFRIDCVSKVVRLQQFYEVIEDDEVKKIIELGLEQFVKGSA